MVTVKNYHVRQTAENKPYVSLELAGDLEMVQSQNTGRFYAIQGRCFICSTLDTLVLLASRFTYVPDG